ncbi:dTDP-6-deoxy-L-hexose 3-O-methyltransferase, partial [Escherichia coli]
LSGNYPVTPDSWISCSERMPKKNQNVLISVNFDSDLVEPLICSARYTGSTFRRGEATIKPGNGVEQVTHWMPLPEPPQEVNRG